MVNKKARERRILEMVYDCAEFAEVLDSESPDFLLRHHGSEVYFGVEVTEYYASGLQARLRHIPEYFKQLVDSEEARHRDDKGLVSTVRITDPEGADKGTAKAIIERMPTHEDYGRDLADLIVAKSSKAMGYRRNVEHVNLILLDHQGSPILKWDLDRFHEFYFQPAMKTALARTPFREVFLLVPLGVEERSLYYVPLRLVYLISEAYLLNGFHFREGGTKGAEPSTNEQLAFLAAYLRAQGAHAYLARWKDDSVEAVLGNAGLVLTGPEVAIHDYNDRRVPEPSAEGLLAAASKRISTEFLTAYAEYAAACAFKSGLYKASRFDESHLWVNDVNSGESNGV